MKTIAILGSTGSVGVTTLDVIARFPGRFRVCALAAGYNLDLLVEQVRAFGPEVVSVATPAVARDLAARLGSHEVQILNGVEGALAVATHASAELVMCSLVGALGLRPTLAAINAGKDIGLANKEVLVVGGELVTAAAKKSHVRLLPVDSEHNAIFQCLEGRQRCNVKRVVLTASGGPFRELPLECFSAVTVADALRHPTWQMGNKITIDSATLMNKGLEVIEARWLFDLTIDQIAVVIHPQSVIHSMVEMIDGSVMAEMAIPDMAIPVAYALAFPERLAMSHLPPLSLTDCAKLTFEQPDLGRFPCLRLAYDALREGGTMPACLNAANEELVAAFLSGRLPFVGIPRHIEAVMSRHRNFAPRTLEDLIETDGWARAAARELIAA
jgi:1-deoxy-D-xylulose-5-phosphate reductoisomerase